jgi:uncharacterized repeat protein (TIGR01451 family)
MHKISVFSALILLFSSTLFAQPIQWKKINQPPGGFGFDLKQDVNGIIYTKLFSFDTGLSYQYWSSDGGLSWQRISTPPDPIQEKKIIVCQDGNLYFEDEVNYLLYKSSNIGQSWQLVGPLPGVGRLFALPGGVLLLSAVSNTAIQLVRSTDGGLNWQTILDSTYVDAFFQNPYTGEVFAWSPIIGFLEPIRLLRSQDMGVTWSPIFQKNAEDVDHNPSLAFSPDGDIFMGLSGLFWRYLDGGIKWDSIDIEPTVNWEVTVAYNSSGRLFCNELNSSFYSDDKGSSWQPLTDSYDNKYVSFTGVNNDVLFAQRKPGSLYRSIDNGQSWQFAATGLGLPNSQSADAIPIDANRLLRQTADGWFYTSDGGNSWRLVWDQSNRSKYSEAFRVLSKDSWFYLSKGRLIHFRNEGTEYSVYPAPEADSPLDALNLTTNPYNGFLYLHHNNTWFYVSRDSGISWDTLDPKFNYYPNSEIIPLTDGSLYGINSNFMARSSNDGITWSKISNPCNYGFLLDDLVVKDPMDKLHSIGVDGESRYYICTSDDGGLSWESDPPLDPSLFSNKFGKRLNNTFAIDNAGNKYLHGLEQAKTYFSFDGGISFNSLDDPTDFDQSYGAYLSITPDQYLYLNGTHRSVEPVTSINMIEGSTWYDKDGNCQISTGLDTLFGKRIIKIEMNGQESYAYTDENALFRVPVSDGPVQVSIVPLNEYWADCKINLNIPVDSIAYHLDSVYLSLKALINSPRMEVQVSAPFLRRCFESEMTVSFQNTGTVNADGVYIELTLDSLVDFISANWPVAGQSGQTLTFDIGEVPVGGSNSFKVFVKTSCNAALGVTHCFQAHIYPDTLPTTSSWPQVSTQAVCEGDSIRFVLENIGQQAMTEAMPWNIVDATQAPGLNSILANGTILLQQGETFSINVPSVSDELHLFAKQVSAYPFNQYSNTIVRNCGSNQEPLSIVNLDKEGPFTDKFCISNIGAFDPNDKQGFPQGLTDQGFIPEEQPLSYLIRFQNTGTDTAFNVVIKDTLPVQLEASSVQFSASSHACNMRLTSEGVLTFIFENVLLPDSNINEPASHGFVEYFIRQRPGNSFGDQIRNRAAIYFDYNDPVITNSTLHTIGIPFVTRTENPTQDQLVFDVMPNPFSSSFQIVLLEDQPRKNGFRVEMLLPDGRIALSKWVSGESILIGRDNLPVGLYFLVLRDEYGRVLGRRRVVAKSK